MCRIDNGFGSRRHLLNAICFFSGRPQKSIQQILSCCITPPAALCDVQISLLLFLIGFLLLLYFNPFARFVKFYRQIPRRFRIVSYISCSIAITFSTGTLLKTGIFILNRIQKKEYTPNARNTAPDKSRIALRSVGSVEILQIINTVPAIPTSGSTGPNGTLKLLGAFGRRCRSTSTSICAKYKTPSRIPIQPE